MCGRKKQFIKYLRKLYERVQNCESSILKEVITKNYINRLEVEIGKYYIDKSANDRFNSPLIAGLPSLLMMDEEYCINYCVAKPQKKEPSTRFLQAVEHIELQLSGEKKKNLKNKLNELLRIHFSNKKKDIRQLIYEKFNPIFYEIIVVGEYATQFDLLNIDVQVSRATGSNVDAEMIIATRGVLVEVTIILDKTDFRTRPLLPEKAAGEVKDRIITKAESGKQLALSKKPSILVIGFNALLDWNVSDPLKDAIELLKNDKNSKGLKKISAIIMSQSLLFNRRYIWFNEEVEVDNQLTTEERDRVVERFTCILNKAPGMKPGASL